MKRMLTASVFCLLAGTAAYSQNQQRVSKKYIPAHYNGSSLFAVLRDLQARTGLRNIMDGECAKYTVPVFFNKDSATVEEVLEHAFKDQPVTYTLSPVIIVVLPKAVKVRVTDPDGKPLAGVTVAGAIRKGVTNEHGEFILLEATCDPSIEFSYVGYETFIYEQYGDTLVTVKMKINPVTQDSALKVNTGYQVLPKERATGSYATISKKQLERQVTTSILSKMEGRAPGLLLNKNRMPGTNLPFISIRGQSTISANTEPLYVLDNLPYYGNIENINPNDIESITVLKDAAATSIWGARAGNGVVVLTTKKGSDLRKPILELNNALTITAKPDLWYLPLPSSKEYIEINSKLFADNNFDGALGSMYALVPPDVEIMQQYKLGEITEKEREAQLDQLRSQDVRDDLNRLFYQTGLTNRHTLSVTGGSENLKYYVGGGFENEKMTQVDSYRQRTTLTGNLTFNKNFYEIGIQGFFTDNRSKSHPSPDWFYPYSALADANGAPNAVPRDLKSDYKDSVSNLVQDWAYRPLQETRETATNRKGLHTRLILTGKLYLTSDLNVQFIYERQQGSDEINDVKSATSYYARNLQNRFAVNNGGVVKYLIPLGGILDMETNEYIANKARLQLNYEWHKHRNFRVSALGGIEYGKFKTDSFSMRYFGYFGDLNRAVPSNKFDGSYPVFYDKNVIDRVPNFNHAGSGFDFYPSAFVNAGLTIWRRYALTISGRIDQSNLFGLHTNNQSIPLWSLGFKWNAGDESFYPLSFLPYCTLRASYGYSGNVDKRTTAYASAVIGPANRYNAIPMEIISPYNPDLRWERSGLLNTAIELADRKRQWEVSFEYYRRKSGFLLAPGAQDPTLGSSFFWGNNASMKGSGFDFNLSTNHTFGRKWRLNNLLLLSKTTNKVTRYDNPNKEAWLYTAPGFLSPNKGAPVYSLYAYKWGGLDAAGDPQGYVNGNLSKNYDSILTASPNSLIRTGSSVPAYFGSFYTSLGYGQFTLAATLVFKGDYYIRRSSVNYSEPNNVVFAGLNDYANRWQNPGDEKNTYVPSVKIDPTRDLFYNNLQPLVVKGDQIRLHDVSLTYSMPSTILKNRKLQALNFYVIGNNLGFLWKAAPGKIDPDYLQGSPEPRSITIGVKCTF
ncbi:MAG: SusC/RagA family TonB-linked outer membrane protein [Niastella sp.]|uniref:SusC/RagA family TonB-linked outer membrane protein n=1 Tax=Niastella sp. TaxID=1869183 RepID=UPI00389A7A4E